MCHWRNPKSGRESKRHLAVTMPLRLWPALLDGGQPEVSGGLLEEGAEALTLGEPAALRSIFCTKSCCFL